MENLVYSSSDHYFPNESHSQEVHDMFWRCLVWCEENWPIVWKRFRSVPDDMEYDKVFVIRSHCIRAAFHAAVSHDPEKGRHWMNWFLLKLHYEVLDARKLNALRMAQRRVFRIGDLQLDSVLDVSCIHLSPDKLNNVEEFAVWDDVQKMLDCATSGRTREALKMRILGASIPEIAEQLGMCRRDVHTIMSFGRSKIRAWCREHAPEYLTDRGGR